MYDYILAIPPPALSGSGSRVEGFRPSSQPDATGLPVQNVFFSDSLIRLENYRSSKKSIDIVSITNDGKPVKREWAIAVSVEIHFSACSISARISALFVSTLP